MVADVHIAEMPPVETKGGLLGTTVRWATFLFLVDTLLASLATLAFVRGEVGLALPIAYVSGSLLSVSTLYFIAASGANPGPILKGRRAPWLQPLLIPYRFVAWSVCVAARVIRRGLLPVAEVAPGLFLGMRLFPSEVWRLEAERIDCVMDLAAELPSNARIADGSYDRYELPVLDRCAPELDETARAADWVVDRLNAGKRVYLHCAFGRGRSAMMAAAVLMRLGVANGPEQAVRAVKRARPLIGVKGVQFERLQQYAARLGAQR